MKKIHTGVKTKRTKEDYVTFSYIINKWSCLHNKEILFIKYKEYSFQLESFAQRPTVYFILISTLRGGGIKRKHKMQTLSAGIV